jgi:hypothetical protein
VNKLLYIWCIVSAYFSVEHTMSALIWGEWNSEQKYSKRNT